MLLTDCFNFTQFQISLFYCLHDILFDSDQVVRVMNNVYFCLHQHATQKISRWGGQAFIPQYFCRRGGPGLDYVIFLSEGLGLGYGGGIMRTTPSVYVSGIRLCIGQYF